MAEGTIIKALSGFYYVHSAGRIVTCRARGKFRHGKCSPLVGDRVTFTPLEGGNGALDAILPRSNQFIRPAVANVDQLVIIVSQAIPVTDPFLIDRIITVASGRECSCIVCVNKCDLDRKLDITSIDNDNVIEINTVEFDKIDVLKDKINEMFNLDKIEQSDYTYLSNIRQISLAKECLSILGEVESAVEREDPVDLIEIDIKRIWTKLGEIIGDTYSDELIDQLFSQFCLGK